MPNPTIEKKPQFEIAEEKINAKHLQLGGDNGILGTLKQEKSILKGGKQGILKECDDKKGFYKVYQHGAIYWTSKTGAIEIHAEIYAKWISMGEEKGLGYPVEDVKETPDGNGKFSRFDNGMIYWTHATGAHEIQGEILAKWSSMGFEKSLLGYPVEDEKGTPDGSGKFNRFQNGMIYWSPQWGAHEIHGEILKRWSAMGFERSWLGYPNSDESDCVDGGRVSYFMLGQIYWWPDLGTIVHLGLKLSHKPSNLWHTHGNLVFPEGIAITAHYDLAMTPEGDVSFSGSAHCSSSVVTYNYGVVILLMTPGGLSAYVSHEGHVSNPLIGQTNDDLWSENSSKQKDFIKNNWEEFKQARVVEPPELSSDTLLLGESVTDLLSKGLKDLGIAAATSLL